MRKKHASFHGQISKEQFVHASPNFNVELEYLLRNWTAEAFWLPADTRGITIYGDYPAYDLLGIQIHPSPQTYAGAAFARFFPLHGPEEVIAEVEIHRSTSTLSNPLVIIVSRYLSQAYPTLLKKIPQAKNQLEPSMFNWSS